MTRKDFFFNIYLFIDDNDYHTLNNKQLKQET